MLSIRLRIEQQGNESAQLASLLGSMKATPFRGSKMDYFMLRMPKINEDSDDGEENVDGDEDSNSNPFLARAITIKQTNSAVNLGGGNDLLASKLNRKASLRLRMSVKVNLRSTETQLQLNKLLVISKKKSTTDDKEEVKGGSGGIDLEERKS